MQSILFVSHQNLVIYRQTDKSVYRVALQLKRKEEMGESNVILTEQVSELERKKLLQTSRFNRLVQGEGGEVPTC